MSMCSMRSSRTAPFAIPGPRTMNGTCVPSSYRNCLPRAWLMPWSVMKKIDGVVEQFLLLQPRDHVADFLVRVPAAVEVVGPVLKNHRVARVVRREHHVRGLRVRAEFLCHAVLPGRVRSLPAVLPAVQLNLHEERLTRLAPGPVVAVVHLAVPLEVVIGLAELVAGRLEPADARVVAGLLEQHRDRHHVARQRDLQFAAPAAVVVRADGRLVAPGDEGGPARGTDRGGHERLAEPRAVLRELIDVRGPDQLLPVTGEVGRHVVHDDPDDVRPRRRFGGRRRWREEEKEERGETVHGRASGRGAVTSCAGRNR